MTKHTFKGNPIPLAMAELFIENLTSILDNRYEKIFFGGSYVRQSAQCGDIDLAILRNADTTLALNDLAEQRLHVLADGNSLKRWVMFPNNPFQLDMWLVSDIAQWGPLCMFVAGNGVLNVKQRQLATRAGYILSQYGVTDARTKQSVGSFPTEQSVYKFFGWHWIPYSLRNARF